ncbi:MAG: lysophospholipid acyltransferase family protein [Chthoniobacterales bacterium]|nr:lysophospholipid acyltransferase family protein [Chthoniobacterales bacterium]
MMDKKTRALWRKLPFLRRVRYRLEYAGLKLVAVLVPHLPWVAVRWLACVLGSVAFLFDRVGRAVALANIGMAFGGEKGPAEMRRIARDSYRNFARTMLELFWAENFTAENYHQYMVMEGWDQARRLNKEHKGGIFVCLHYGNFEWLSIAGAFERLPGCIVTQEFKNPLLGPVFDRLRSLSGHRIIQRERAMLITMQHLRNGGNIGVLIDLQVGPKHPSVPVRSFGRLSAVTRLHTMLQKRMGYPIIPIESVPLPDGRYRTIAHDPIYFAPDVTEREIAQTCWDFFEAQIRRQPEAWLWSYRHWRFKPAGAGDSYPFYAVQKKPFDQLIASMPDVED